MSCVTGSVPDSNMAAIPAQFDPVLYSGRHNA